MLLVIACLCCAAQSPQSPSSQPDTTGSADLIVNTELLSHQWVVRDEKLDAVACSVEEGGVTPGTRTIVRFTVETPNVGDADIVVGDPNVHVANNDGLFEFATCHHHYHFRHYALYQLIDPATGFVWKAAKKGFCMLDTDPVPAADGTEPTTEFAIQELRRDRHSRQPGHQPWLGGHLPLLPGRTVFCAGWWRRPARCAAGELHNPNHGKSAVYAYGQ
jgi:hypothetical protein